MSFNRRDFIIKGGQLALASSVLPSIAMAAEKSSRFQLALSQYSLREMFKSGALAALDFPAFTKDTFGIEAIDLWEGGLPKDQLDNKSYLEKLKGRADSAGVDLFLHMAGTLQSPPKKFKKSFTNIIKSLDRAKILGTNFLRVFLYAENLQDAEVAMTKLCDEAAKRHIKIIIEPVPKGKGREGVFLAQLYKKMSHPYLTLMPDFGKLKDNIYTGTKAMLPYSESISAKMHSFDENGKQPDFDYDRLAKMIIDSKYKGYIAIEWEGRTLKPIEGVNASKKLIKDSFGKYGVKVS